MSISQDDIIQTQTGNFNATAGNATLPSGTTDGNTVIIAVMVAGAFSPTIAGFTRSHGSSIGNARVYILQKANTVAAETTWAIGGVGTASPVVWVAMEVQNLSKLALVETFGSPSVSAQSGTSVATQTSGTSYSFETLGFAIHGGNNTANATIPVWSGTTGNFLPIATSGRAEAATACSISVSLMTGTDVGTYQSTSTSSVTLAAANASLVIYNADAAHRVPDIDIISGAEHGTEAGRATGITGGPPVDFTNGTVTVSTTSPRTGTYSWQATGSAAAANFGWTSTGAMSLYTAPTGYTAHRQYVGRFSFYMPTLPGADVTVAAIDNGSGLSGAGCQLVYRTASQKLGMQVVQDTLHVGTEVLSAVAVTAAAWHDVDVYLDMTNRNRESQFHAYWRLDGVDQTEASAATDTSSAVSTFTRATLGWTTASTATIRYDDIAWSKRPGCYPLGDIGIHAVTVDPAGTVTVTTAANFSTMTANGTLNATFSTTTARGAVDELPPTIGASADGFVQDTLAATDYVELPMTTWDVYTNLGALRAIRWYFCGWAAAAGPTTAATIGFRAWDGTAETTLFAAAEPNFTSSTTTPSWICRMQRTLASNVPPALTQAGLDALAARVGFSTDATPVVGIHAAYAEVAVRAVATQTVQEQDGVLIIELYDPDTGNVIAFRLDATATAAAWADYVINGSTVHQFAAGGTTDLLIVGAESNSAVSFVTGGLQ
jgi:hypothetical protein